MLDDCDNTATPEKRANFLMLLAECGNVSKSARESGLNRPALYVYRDANPEFSSAWGEAEKLGVRGLEDEARRRAYEGTLRPVFHRGIECGKICEYSDTLLIFLLKAHDPKYADKQQIALKGDIINRAVQADPVDVMAAMRAIVKDGNG